MGILAKKQIEAWKKRNKAIFEVAFCLYKHILIVSAEQQLILNSLKKSYDISSN